MNYPPLRETFFIPLKEIQKGLKTRNLEEIRDFFEDPLGLLYIKPLRSEDHPKGVLLTNDAKAEKYLLFDGVWPSLLKPETLPAKPPLRNWEARGLSEIGLRIKNRVNPIAPETPPRRYLVKALCDRWQVTLSVRGLKKFLPREIPHKNLTNEIVKNKRLRQEIDRRIEERTKSGLFSRHPILEHTKETLILRGDLLVEHPMLYEQTAWSVIKACLEIGVYPQLGIWRIK